MNHSVKTRRHALHQTHHHYYLNISVEAANLSDWRIESNRIESKLFCPNWNALISITPAHRSVPAPRPPAPRSALAPPYFVTRPLAQLSSRSLRFNTSSARMLWSAEECRRSREIAKMKREPENRLEAARQIGSESIYTG